MAEQSDPLNPFLGDQSSQSPGSPNAAPREVVPSVGVSAFHNEPIVDTSIPVDSDIPTPASKWRHRVVRRSVLALVLMTLIAGGVYWWSRDTISTPVAEESTRVSEVVRDTISSHIVPKDDASVLSDDNANYESENFKAGEIVIGGELQFLVDENEVGALTLENIRGEAFTEKNKQEVKLIVTWTTNKLSQASVRYSKGIGQTERALDEEDYSYNHSVILSGLDPASTYLYTIDAGDRYGNRVKSEPHAVFTGARTVSLFELIAGAIGEVFGWAVTNK